MNLFVVFCSSNTKRSEVSDVFFFQLENGFSSAFSVCDPDFSFLGQADQISSSASLELLTPPWLHCLLTTNKISVPLPCWEFLARKVKNLRKRRYTRVAILSTSRQRQTNVKWIVFRLNNYWVFNVQKNTTPGDMEDVEDIYTASPTSYQLKMLASLDWKLHWMRFGLSTSVD